ncbi:hypothetical protein L6452_42578 [Arctium lappa]|uniref:Uncharacterized protein n=1 Tax=Arctium lappa TaxID=4217 RepID=A0ACB8XI14_ARCLA|nr:hypothetical protein L6452_42578 [Arctium lappa]
MKGSFWKSTMEIVQPVLFMEIDEGKLLKIDENRPWKSMEIVLGNPWKSMEIKSSNQFCSWKSSMEIDEGKLLEIDGDYGDDGDEGKLLEMVIMEMKGSFWRW